MPVSGEKIRIARKRMGLSRARLAEQIGISPRSIEAWEHGRYPLRKIDLIIKLADALLLNPAELWEDPPPEAPIPPGEAAPGDGGLFPCGSRDSRDRLEAFVFARCVRTFHQRLGLEGLLQIFERSFLASCQEEVLSEQEKEWKSAWEQFPDPGQTESSCQGPDSLPRLFLEARTAAGLTQAELARRAGTDQATVSRLESGKKLPSLPVLSRLAESLGKQLAVTLHP